MKIHVQITAPPRRLDDGSLETTVQVHATGDGSPAFPITTTAVHSGDADTTTVLAEIKAHTVAQAAQMGLQISTSDVLVWGGPQ